MDFAEKQLQKHGWQAGDGLGKEKTGIKEAIKVKIKNDNRGVGHDSGREFTYHWWDHMFNKTADNIQIQESKGATLTDGRENKPDGHVSESSEEEDEKHQPCLVPDREEEVFKMCGGRTAHKGARHGLKLNGKLARIEEQERLAQLKSVEVTHGNRIKKKSSNTDEETAQVVRETVAIASTDAGNLHTENAFEECGTKTETKFENCDEEIEKKSKKKKEVKEKDRNQKDERESVVDNETESKLVSGVTDIPTKDADTQKNSAPMSCELRNEDIASHVEVEKRENEKKQKKGKYNTGSDDDIESAHSVVKTESETDSTNLNKLKRKKNRE